MFKEILEAAWGWKERTPKQEREEIAEIFEIDLSDDYIGHGMNAVVERLCSKGKGSTYIYFWFHEYRNSCYDISLRASAIKTNEQAGGHNSGGCAPSA